MRRLDVQLVEVLDTDKGKYTVGESAHNKAGFDELKRSIFMIGEKPTHEQDSQRG